MSGRTTETVLRELLARIPDSDTSDAATVVRALVARLDAKAARRAAKEAA